MVAKVSFRNSLDNSITIDTSYRNLSLSYVATATAGSRKLIPNFSPYNSVLRAYYSANPFSVIPSLNGNYSDLKCKDYYTFTQNLTIYEFADMDVIVPSSGARMVVRNDIGIPVFSSAMKPMRVVRFIQGAVDNGTPKVIFDGIIEAGRKFAFCICEQPMRVTSGKDEMQFRTIVCSSDTNTGYVKIEYKLAYVDYLKTGAFRGTIQSNSRYTILILDVTDYD